MLIILNLSKYTVTSANMVTVLKMVKKLMGDYRNKDSSLAFN